MKKHDSLKVLSVMSFCLFIAIFVFVPTAFILIVSILSSDSLGNITLEFTLENFKKLLDPIYLEVLFNSLKISAVTTLATLLAAYPLAYIVSRMNKKAQFTLMLLIILPYWTNSLVRTYSFLVILRADGIVNQLLMSIGLIDRPIQLLYTDGAVIFSMIYLYLPVMFLPIFSSIEKLDKTYIEASRDLGAGSFDTFTKVVLPLTLPGVIAGCILVFTPCLGLFFISDLIGGGKTVLLGNVIRDQFSTTRNLPFGSALSVVMMLIAMAFIGLYYRVLLINSGGVKKHE